MIKQKSIITDVLTGIVTVLGVFVAIGANAATIEFTLLESRWANPVGGNITFQDPTSPNFANPAVIRWGTNSPTGEGDSGYDFTARNTPFATSETSVFGLGEFAHENFTIPTGTWISSVDLLLRGVLNVDSGPDQEVQFDYRFFHNETPNSPPSGLCAAGGTQPCPDLVSFEALSSTDRVLIDGSPFALNILGFATSLENAENGIFDSEALTLEGQRNTRILAAEFAPVPIPAALPLFASAIAGLGIVGLRRKRSQ